MSRHVAKACRVPRALLDILEQYGGTTGSMLAAVQKQSMIELWHKASAPKDDPMRGSLAGRCDREWFANTFCGGKSVSTEYSFLVGCI